MAVICRELSRELSPENKPLDMRKPPVAPFIFRRIKANEGSNLSACNDDNNTKDGHSASDTAKHGRAYVR